jgi:hypothetical protein
VVCPPSLPLSDHPDLTSNSLRIFILEGLLTVVIALAAPFIIPDDPKTAKFLSEDEKNFLMYRIQADQGCEDMTSQSAEPFKSKYFWAAVKDWKVWVSILVYFGNSIPVYGCVYPTNLSILTNTYLQFHLHTPNRN